MSEIKLARIGVIGASGSLGKPIADAFIDALKTKKIESLHITTSKASSLIEYLEGNGAKVFIVDYSDVEDVAKALEGLDV